MKEILQKAPIIDIDKNSYIVDRELFLDFYNEVHIPAYKTFLKDHYNLITERLDPLEKGRAWIEVEKLNKFNETKPVFNNFRGKFYTYKIITGDNDISIKLLSVEEVTNVLNELFHRYSEEQPR